MKNSIFSLEDEYEFNQGKKPRILVVDDENTVLNICRITLEKDGYEVVTAENGLAALELSLIHI